MDSGHEDDWIVPRSRIRLVAGQGGSAGTRSMLFSEPLHEAVWQCEWQ